MHQNAANGVGADAPFFVPPAIDGVGDADLAWVLSLKRELCRVMKDQHRVFPRHEAVVRRLKMAREDGSFVDPPVGEKAIRSLGVRPILPSRTSANSHAAASRSIQLLSRRPSLPITKHPPNRFGCSQRNHN